MEGPHLLSLAILLVLAALHSAHGTYIGCYRETFPSRKFGESPGNYDLSNLSPLACQRACVTWFFQYAAMASGQFCFCAKTLPDSSFVADGGMCYEACSDASSNSKCGSHTHVSVYKTLIPVKGLELKTVGSNIVETGSPVSLEYSVRSGPSPLEFWADYGDGAGQTSHNATAMDVQTYSVPGEYLVTIFAQDKDGASQAEAYSIPVLAQSPVGHVQLQCPDFVLALEEFECNATVLSGNSISVRSEFGDNGVVDDYPIFDPKWHTAGQEGIPQHDEFPDDISLNNKVCLMPDSEFQFPGTLLGWEFYANATGNVVFLVLEPTCSVNAYCHKTNDCPATCSPANEWTCSGANSMFCPMHGVCTDAALTANCSGINRYTSLPTGYKVIGNFPHTITVSGHNYFAVDLATNRVEVKPGDVIGVVQTAGMLGLRPNLTGEEQDRYHAFITGDQAVGVTFTKTDFLLTSDKLLVRAVASRATTVLAFHTYAGEGTFTVSLNFSTSYTSSFILETTSVISLLGINASIIDSPDFGSTGIAVTFTVKEHTGANATYVWHFGDGTNLTTTDQTTTHIYSFKGNYDVNVTTSNSLSSKSNITSITIQDNLVGLAVDANITGVAQSTDFAFTLAGGSDYKCSWDFGDTSAVEVTNDTTTPVAVLTTRTHSYATDGTFGVNVTCWNEVSKSTLTFNENVVWPISNMQLSPAGALKNAPFHVQFTYGQGTNPTFQLIFDGVVRPTTLDTVAKTGQTITQLSSLSSGLYPVSLRGTNLVSDEMIYRNFTIDAPIVGQTSTVDRTVGVTSDPFTFSVTMTEGSSVDVIMIFKDGTNNTYSIGTLVDWTPGYTHSVIHLFTTGGTFNVEVTIKNFRDSYTFNHPITVYNTVANLTLASNAPVPYIDGSGTVSFYFTTDGDPPVGAQVEFQDYGDGSPGSGLMSFALGQVYPHVYPNKGSYDAVANISNLISWAVYRLRVSLVVPITNMQLHVKPSHAPIGQPVSVGFSMDTGIDVTISVEFGDGSPSVSIPRLGDTPWSIDSVDHTFTTYASSGYTMVVTASNSLGNVTMTYLILSQFVVTRDFTLTSNSPKEYLGIPVSVGFTLSFPVTGQLPSDADFQWVWGDGTQEAPVPLPLTSAPSVLTTSATHAYSAAGDYIASVIIGNKVNREEFKVSAGVYERITGLGVTPMYSPAVPLVGPDLAGFGPDHERFPLTRPVKFHFTIATGTVSLYDLTAVEVGGTAVQQCNHSASPASLLFNTPGTYDVTVVASNPLPSLSSQTVRVVIGTMPTQTKITVSYINPNDWKMERTFNVSFGTINTEDTCIKIDFGDGYISTYGNSTVCQAMFGMAPKGAVGFVNLIIHTFNNKGQYTITVTAKNAMGSTSDSLTVTVSNKDCTSPIVSIKNAAPNFYQPTEKTKNLLLAVRGVVNLNCSSLTNAKEWTIEKVDTNYGTTLKTIDITSIASRFNADIGVPGRFLEYGLYKFTFNVTMNGPSLGSKDIFSNFVVTYVRIVASPIVALLVEGGMSLITRGRRHDVTFDAALFSRDPDINPDLPQGFTKFEWFCRQLGESLNTNTDGTYDRSTPSSPYTLAQLDAGIALDNGGCFRQGKGAISNGGASSLTFNTDNMYENETYVFEVFVYKLDRVSKAVINLEIVVGEPPAVVIKCKDDLCRMTEGGITINPSNRLAVQAMCTQCEGVTFEWSFYRAGLNNAWLPIPKKIILKHIKGEKSQEVSIDQATFAEGFRVYANLTMYRLKLTVQRPGGTPGVAYTVVRLNMPPAGGSCSLFPADGQAMLNQRRINCSGWEDGDGIKLYRYYVKFKNDPVERQLWFGPEHDVNVYMPLGPEHDNFEMSVYCRVQDRLGASVDFSIGKAKSRPMEAAKLKKRINDLLNSPNNALAIALAEADMTSANRESLNVASGLNSARKMVYTEYSGMGIAIAATRSAKGYGVQYINWEKIRKNNNWTQEELDVKKTTYEIARDGRGKIRTHIAEIISRKLTKVTSQDIQLCASTLAMVTSAPEEVSRNAQEAISEAFVDMSYSLEMMASKTPYKDMKNIVTTLVEGAGNTIEALQISRSDGMITELDQAQLSEDFEYESNLFSDRMRLDEIDPVKRTLYLTKETNGIVQTGANQKTAPRIMDSVMQMGRTLAKLAVPGQDPVEIRTQKMILTVHKDMANKITGRLMQLGRGSYRMPPFCNMHRTNTPCDPNQPIAIVATETPNNAFPVMRDPIQAKKVNKKSGTITIDMYNNNNQIMQVQNSPHDIEILIPRDPNMQVPAPNHVSAVIPDRADAHLFYQCFNVTTDEASVHVEIRPDDTDVQFLVLLRYNKFPQLNGTDRGWNWVGNSPSSMAQALRYLKLSDIKKREQADPWIIIMDNKLINNRKGRWCLGLRQNSEAEKDKYNMNQEPPVPASFTGTPTCNHTFRSFTSGCYFYREKLVKGKAVPEWSSDGCYVSSLTSPEQTQCFCNHLTSFGGGWVVEPNAIDWNFVFANADFMSNPTLYITEIIVAVLYIIFLIWARRKDQKDILKLGVTPLPDNNPNDKYFYEVTVQTGLRKNAGTDSKVHMILSGEYDETDVRILEDSQRKVLRRGETDTFLVSVPRPLGPLSYARIWHDNSGKGKFTGWYCNYIVMRDLQTNKRSYFIINRWFAVEEDDGQVDRLIPVASSDDMKQFGHLFSQRATRSLGDEHIWFSVVARPPQSRFTRVQRVSCCLLLLFSSMLANAMFYEKEAAGTGQGAFTFGPFALTPDQIYIGVMANLIVFPINFLCAYFFRKSRLRRLRTNRINEAMAKSRRGATNGRLSPDYTSPRADLQPIVEVGDERTPTPVRDTAQLTKPLSPALPAQGGDMRPTTATGIVLMQEEAVDIKMKKKKPFSFPWYFSIFGWIILWIGVGVSVAFVTFYGINFGDLKTKKWITSMVISFLMSIFLTQPLKVFLLAMLFSLLFKKADIDDEDIQEDEEDLQVNEGEEYLHPLPGDASYVARERKIAYCPPDSKALEAARDNRLKELKMYDILREILFYGVFLWILLVVSYGFRDPNAFFLKQNLKTMLDDQGLGQFSNYSNSFTKARTMQNFFNWSRNTLAPAMRADVWYNGAPPFGQRGFLDDRVSRIMGYAVMRQLRVRGDLCETVEALRPIIPTCNSPYTMEDEQMGDFGIGWKPATRNANGTLTNSKYEYQYRTAEEMEGWPYWAGHAVYSGGGYVVALNGTTKTLKARFDELETDGWIDRYTRAIFIEFTVYNPSVNLFGIVTMAAEFIVTGGLHAYMRVEPVNLLGFMSDAQLFQLICQAVYLLFILFFIIKEIRKLFKQRKEYFKEPWNYVEWGIIVLSIGATVIYFYRLLLALEKVKYFNATRGNGYMKFQFVGYWNEFLLYMVGWLCFLASVKFIRLLRFNRRMSLLAMTLRHGAKPLFMFGIIFGIVFFAYAQFFYLVYFMELINFSMFVFAAETCLQMLVGKFNFSAMAFVSPVLGPLFFFFYAVTVYYILINMFLTILNESFSAVRRDINIQSNEHEMVEFIMQKFKTWTGLGALLSDSKKAIKTKVTPEVALDSQIDNFPDKIDKFLSSITDAYFDKDTLEAIFFSTNNVHSKEMMKEIMRRDQQKQEVQYEGSAGRSQDGLPEVDSGW